MSKDPLSTRLQGAAGCFIFAVVLGAVGWWLLGGALAAGQSALDPENTMADDAAQVSVVAFLIGAAAALLAIATLVVGLWTLWSPQFKPREPEPR